MSCPPPLEPLAFSRDANSLKDVGNITPSVVLPSNVQTKSRFTKPCVEHNQNSESESRSLLDEMTAASESATKEKMLQKKEQEQKISSTFGDSWLGKKKMHEKETKRKAEVIKTQGNAELKKGKHKCIQMIFH